MPDRKVPMPVKLLVAEGHALFRAGLRFLLQELAVEVELHEAADAGELRKALSAARFDLVLVDQLIAGPDAMLSIRDICERAEGAPVAVLSGIDDPNLIRAALDDGAAGFIPKNSSPRVMIQALRLILAGGIYLPPVILSLLPRTIREEKLDGRRTALTARQQEVWSHLARGASNKQIARVLALSEGAVKAHVAGLLRLLGARNRTEALVRAQEAGWSDAEAAQRIEVSGNGQAGFTPASNPVSLREAEPKMSSPRPETSGR
ncbi:response regulator [Mangrovicella endophytica]|uniref:response regulator n=1 Tax=Mangrovicella endophytica TaxID=2066697 RepID=UPI000C9E2873|nr:response regulator transcription factor [Mangrovicella endophytica]